MPYIHDIDPIALQIGPLAIRWYGLMYLAAGITAFMLGRHRASEIWRGFKREEIEDIIFYGMIGVIVGGRLGSVFFYHFSDFLKDPLMLVRVWEGGMSFHGGLLGVLVAVGWYARKTGRAVFAMYDFVAPVVPIGLGLGRLGNFIGGELWGRHTDLPWGMIFPRAIDTAGHSIEQLKAMAGAGQLAAEARHPSQLYQMLLEGVLLFCILYFVSMKPKPRYLVSGLFALFYGVFRFGVEFVREPDAQLGYLAWGWLTMGQILSLPLILLGVVLLLASRSAPTLQPRVVADPVPGKKS